MRETAAAKSIVLIAIFFASASLAGAAWSINPLAQPQNPENVSDTDTAMRVVSVTGDFDSDTAVDLVPPSQFTKANRTLNFIYNTTGGTRTELNHLYSGYYYANVSVNTSTGNSITYEIREEDTGNIVTNTTRRLDIGNLSVQIVNSKDELHDNMKFGEQFKAKINATDLWNNEHEPNADVTLWFTNGSWTSQVYKIDNYNDAEDYYFNSEVEIPDNADARYVMQVNASYPGASYSDPYGSTSIEINTLPKIQAEFTEMSTGAGCNNNSFFRACERGANISVGLNITKSYAENVNMTLQAINESGGWENLTTKRMQKSGGTYHASFTIPDLDTSIYQKELRFKYNATSPKRTDIGYYNINYRSFRTFYRSPSVTSAGDYYLNVEFRKYFTPTPLNTSRMSATVKVVKPTGDQYATYSLSEMVYDQVEGWFTKNLDIPYDAEEGIWTVKVNATNIYGESKQSQFTFRLTNVTRTFRAEDKLARTVDKRGIQEFDLQVRNLLSEQQLELKPVVGDAIEGFTTVNSGNNLTLSAGAVSNFTVELNITDVQSYDSKIELQDVDSSYNETVQVRIDGPVCVQKIGPVCVQGTVPEIDEDKVGHRVETVETLFIGRTDEAVNLTSSVEGNISQYVDVEPSKVLMNATEDAETVELNYSVVTPGYFTGNLTLSAGGETGKLELELNSTVQPRDVSIQVTDSINFGYIRSGSDVSREVSINNTGTATVESLDFSSATYSVEADSVSLTPGEGTKVELTLTSVESGSGQITVTASTTAGSVSRTISVSGNVVPNYVQKATQLESEMPTLDAKIPQDSRLQTQLNNVQQKISSVKAAYRKGNYQRAQSLYSEARTTINSIRQRAAQLQQGNQQDNQNKDTGGTPFLLIAVIVVILLLLGFVLYSSLIPEEGDPLYDVLGR
ncbi:MAG: hypothetical protein ABEJ98_01020 [Candidatus Nanohaloarchaea archaeon]